jgi:hypothetical protein
LRSIITQHGLEGVTSLLISSGSTVHLRNVLSDTSFKRVCVLAGNNSEAYINTLLSMPAFSTARLDFSESNSAASIEAETYDAVFLDGPFEYHMACGYLNFAYSSVRPGGLVVGTHYTDEFVDGIQCGTSIALHDFLRTNIVDGFFTTEIDEGIWLLRKPLF